MKTIVTFLSLASIGLGSTIISSSLSSTSATDITFYTEFGGTLSAQPSSSAVDPALTSALSGTPSAAGGNVELFAGSDGLTDMSASSVFANATPVVLTTSHAGGNIDIRSLNGQDWFIDSNMAYNLSYGADNLANQYFGDLYNAVSGAATSIAAQVGLATLSPADRGALYDDFVSNGGFAQISDPNISYVCVDSNGFPSVGLAGFEDASVRIAELTGLSLADINANFANGFQASEVAIVNDEPVYSFTAVDSGVELPDGRRSYTGTYEVKGSFTIPEPSSALLMLLGGLTFISRRKR